MCEHIVVPFKLSGPYLSQGSKKPMSCSHCLCAPVGYKLFPEGNCGCYIVRKKKLRHGEPVWGKAVHYKNFYIF